MKGELSKKKFDRVNKGRLYVTEGKVKGVGVAADFGAKVDVGEGSVGRKLDFVEEMGAEGSDEVVGVFAKVGVLGEKIDEIPN